MLPRRLCYSVDFVSISVGTSSRFWWIPDFASPRRTRLGVARGASGVIRLIRMKRLQKGSLNSSRRQREMKRVFWYVAGVGGSISGIEWWPRLLTTTITEASFNRLKKVWMLWLAMVREMWCFLTKPGRRYNSMAEANKFISEFYTNNV